MTERSSQRSNPAEREQLLEKFKALSVDHYVASEEGDYETVNKGVAAIEQIVRELWDSGGRTKAALKELAELSRDPDPRVAIKAVIYTVELYPNVADELKRLKRSKGLVGLAARHALQHVENGNARWLSEALRGRPEEAS